MECWKIPFYTALNPLERMMGLRFFYQVTLLQTGSGGVML